MLVTVKAPEEAQLSMSGPEQARTKVEAVPTPMAKEIIAKMATVTRTLSIRISLSRLELSVFLACVTGGTASAALKESSAFMTVGGVASEELVETSLN